MNDKQREEALKDIDRVLNIDYGVSGTAWVAESFTTSKACILRWAPQGSTYEKEINAMPDNDVELSVKRGLSGNRPVIAIGILKSLRRDIGAKVHDISFEKMVRLSLFDDLLTQAYDLLNQQYFMPAMVMAGGILEEHIKKLATNNGISFNKTTKVSSLNDELLKINVYSKPEWRQIQTWFDFRNQAAHNDPNFKKT